MRPWLAATKAIVFGLAVLAGCREEPGRCSGAADRLCIEATLEPGFLEPDALSLLAVADTGQRIMASLPGVAQAFADRKRYVVEVDLRSLNAAARRVDLTMVARRGGVELATGMATWSRDDGTRSLVIALRRVHVTADLRSDPADLAPADLRPPDLSMVPAWQTGQDATATLGGTLSRPADVCWSGTRLYVSDQGNHRVLVYNSLASGAMPVAAIGRPDLATTGPAPAASARTMNSPRGLWCDDTSLLVADSLNHRVMFFAANPGTNSPMDGVIGQANFTDGAINRGGGATPAANSLSSPRGVFWDGQRLYIADRDNNRVVIYNAPTKALLTSQSGDAADAVLGQAAFNTAAAAAGPSGLNRPEGVWVEAGRIAVADSNNNRVTFYDVPTGQTRAADAALGQANLTGAMDQRGPGGLYGPTTFRALSGFCVVADRLNNRVLVYRGGLPGANDFGREAIAALGQPNFTEVGMGAGPAQLNRPTGAALVRDAMGLAIVVADEQNNRVQVFRPR